MKQQLNEIKRMQQLAGLIKENNNSTDYPNIDWASVKVGSPETEWDGKTWINISDENGDFYIEMDGLKGAATANKQTYVMDGDNQTYSISPEEAKMIFSKATNGLRDDELNVNNPINDEDDDQSTGSLDDLLKDL
jgi:hypothetical protein